MDFKGDFSGTWQDGMIVPDGEPALPNGTRVTWTPDEPEPTEQQRFAAWKRFIDLAKESDVNLGGKGIPREQLHDRR